jgi:hypothetical protein
MNVTTYSLVFVAVMFGVLNCDEEYSSPDADVGSDSRIGAVPADIAADCSVDITDKLNIWLGTVPDGATITFARDGCYRLDRTFNIVNRDSLTVEGNGATLERKTPTPPTLLNGNSANNTRSHNQHIRIDNSRNITLRNLNVLGLNTVSDLDPTTPRHRALFEPEKFGARYTDDKYGETGLLIKGSDTVTVMQFKTDGTWGDGISLGHDNAPISKNVTLKNISIDRNGRQGISFVSIENALLDNVQVLHSHATGFDLEPNGAKSSVRCVEIRNSYLNAYTVAFALGGLNNISDVYVHDNIVRYTLPSYP